MIIQPRVCLSKPFDKPAVYEKLEHSSSTVHWLADASKGFYVQRTYNYAQVRQRRICRRQNCSTIGPTRWAHKMHGLEKNVNSFCLTKGPTISEM